MLAVDSVTNQVMLKKRRYSTQLSIFPFASSTPQSRRSRSSPRLCSRWSCNPKAFCASRSASTNYGTVSIYRKMKDVLKTWFIFHRKSHRRPPFPESMLKKSMNLCALAGFLQFRASQHIQHFRPFFKQLVDWGVEMNPGFQHWIGGGGDEICNFMPRKWILWVLLRVGHNQSQKRATH